MLGVKGHAIILGCTLSGLTNAMVSRGSVLQENLAPYPVKVRPKLSSKLTNIVGSVVLLAGANMATTIRETNEITILYVGKVNIK